MASAMKRADVVAILRQLEKKEGNGEWTGLQAREVAEDLINWLESSYRVTFEDNRPTNDAPHLKCLVSLFPRLGPAYVLNITTKPKHGGVGVIFGAFDPTNHAYKIPGIFRDSRARLMEELNEVLPVRIKLNKDEPLPVKHRDLDFFVNRLVDVKVRQDFKDVFDRVFRKI